MQENNEESLKIELPKLQIKEDIFKRMHEESKYTRSNIFDYFTSRFFKSSVKSYQEQITISSHYTEENEIIIENNVLEEVDLVEEIENKFQIRKKISLKKKFSISLKLPLLFKLNVNGKFKNLKINDNNIEIKRKSYYFTENRYIELSKQILEIKFIKDFELNEEFEIEHAFNDFEYLIKFSFDPLKKFKLTVMNYFDYINPDKILEISSMISEGTFEKNSNKEDLFKTYGIKMIWSKNFYLPIETPIILIFSDSYDYSLSEKIIFLSIQEKRILLLKIFTFLETIKWKKLNFFENQIFLKKEKSKLQYLFKFDFSKGKSTKFEIVSYFVNYLGFAFKKLKESDRLTDHNLDFQKLNENFEFYFKINAERIVEKSDSIDYGENDKFWKNNQFEKRSKCVGYLYKILGNNKLALDYFDEYFKETHLTNFDIIFLIDYSDCMIKLEKYEKLYSSLELTERKGIELEIAFAISSLRIGNGQLAVDILESCCFKMNHGDFKEKLIISECLYILGSIHYGGNFKNCNMKLASRAFSQSFHILKMFITDEKNEKFEKTFEFLIQSFIETGNIQILEFMENNSLPIDNNSVFYVDIQQFNLVSRKEIQNSILSELQSKLSNSNDNLFLIKCLEALALIKYNLGEFQDAFVLIHNSISIRYRIKYFKDISIMFLNISICLLKMKEITKCKIYLEKAQKLHESIYSANHPSLYRFLKSSAYIYENLEEYDKAIKCCDKSISIIKSFYNSNFLEISKLFHNKSLLFLKKKNLEEALKFCKESLNLKRKFNHLVRTNLEKTLQLKCSILEKMNIREELLNALKEYLDYVESDESLHSQSLLAELHYRISSAYQSLDELKLAKKHIKKSFDFIEITNIMRGEIFGKYGEILARLGCFEDGENMLEQGLAILEKEKYENDDTLIALKGKLMSIRFERKKNKKGDDSSEEEDQPPVDFKQMITQRTIKFRDPGKRTSNF